VRVHIKHGTEGPGFDPYGYTEITAYHNGREVMLHSGLGEYVVVNGTVADDGGDPLKYFTKLVGWNAHQLMVWHYRTKSRCSKCGGRAHHYEPGYPGETMTICKNGHIMDCSFNESAVI
jgi:hypothetical protein